MSVGLGIAAAHLAFIEIGQAFELSALEGEVGGVHVGTEPFGRRVALFQGAERLVQARRQRRRVDRLDFQAAPDPVEAGLNQNREGEIRAGGGIGDAKLGVELA
jgi:hypothetical protein